MAAAWLGEGGAVMTAEEIAEALAAAKARLMTPSPKRPSPARALGAAALAAVSALALAAAVILGPGHEAKDVAPPTVFGDH
jgi:hypothetical protein